jgi:hypothetical protein
LAASTGKHLGPATIFAMAIHRLPLALAAIVLKTSSSSRASAKRVGLLVHQAGHTDTEHGPCEQGRA